MDVVGVFSERIIKCKAQISSLQEQLKTLCRPMLYL